MATPTYTAIASITLGSDVSTVEFASIDQSFRDLVLVANWKPAGNYGQWRLNNDTGSNYSRVFMRGNGSAAGSGSGTSNAAFFNIASSYTSSTEALTILQIMDYSATDKHKTALQRTNANTPNEVEAYAYRWANTAAVTTITIDTQNGSNILTGSTFALYGIAS